MRNEKFIEKIRQIHLHVQETLQKLQEKYKARHDHHKTEKSFKLRDRVWLQLNKERLSGLGEKIKALRYWKGCVIMPIDLVYHHICAFTQL